MSLLVLLADSGTPALIQVAGIASDEVFGAGGKLTLRLTAGAGIASSEIFGAGGKLALRLGHAAGVASSEVFGAGGKVTRRVAMAAGIASAEAFGAGGKTALRLTAGAGIPSGEAFGAGGNVDGGEQPAGPQPYYTAGAPSVPWPPRPAGEIVTLCMKAGIESAEAFGASGQITVLTAPAPAASEPIAPLAIFTTRITRRARPAPIRLAGERGIRSGERFGRGGHLVHVPPPWMLDA